MLLLEQILASLLVNAIGVGCIWLLRCAPPRLTLWVSLASMSAIFVPWVFLGNALVPAQAIAALGAESPNLVTVLPQVTAINASAMFTCVVWFAVIVGLYFAAWTIRQSARATKQWRSVAVLDTDMGQHVHSELLSQLARTRVHRLPGTSRVATTGFWRTEVWIGDRIQNPIQIATALNHELCHVVSRDQFVLFIIVMLERLLWWNPLVWFLGRRARRSMEYACDSRCQALVGSEAYGRSLAEILLLSAPVTTALETSIGNRSDIVHRMENLNMQTKFKSTHLAILSCASLALATVSAIAATDSEQTLAPTLIDCHEHVPKGVHYEFAITSNIDRREGGSIEMSVSLVDPGAEQTEEIPSGAEQFLACVQGVVGVGDDEGWPGT